MNYHIDIEPRTLHFKQPAGTSRGVYVTRQLWLIHLTAEEMPGRNGVGECAPLHDLSCDYGEAYASTLRRLCDLFEQKGEIDYALMRPYPSMLFGLETALLSLQYGSGCLFDTPFSRGEEGIPTNGLVWMGTFEEMSQRMEEKLQQGFRCIKLKIGAIDFDSELALIKNLRQRFSRDVVELRVDANGGFSVAEAPHRLEQLARYDIHSIEQPIRQHQWAAMASLCASTPLPIALDEELIGINIPGMKVEMLDTIKPQYIILKPSLHGGMAGCREWIAMARERGIGSWMTSALESNVGLNAVAQFAAHIYGPNIIMPQGLGTGLLFTDNIDMSLEMRGSQLWIKG